MPRDHPFFYFSLPTLHEEITEGSHGGHSAAIDHVTPVSAAQGVEEALKVLEGRWKLLILFHLFGGKVLRYSDLGRAIPAISQKMLIQQLRQMERDTNVGRFVHHQVPPRVEYSLTAWGQALCPALDALLKRAALRDVKVPPALQTVAETGKGEGRDPDEKRSVPKLAK